MVGKPKPQVPRRNSAPIHFSKCVIITFKKVQNHIYIQVVPDLKTIPESNDSMNTEDGDDISESGSYIQNIMVYENKIIFFNID